MAYHIDLEKILIEDYKNKLVSAYLPPSRKILREDLDKRFDYFKSIGVNNVKELQQLLKKKDNWPELQKQGFLTDDYLTILLRELNSILPKPNKLSDFKRISKETIVKLEKLGIKNTRQLYDKVLNKADRKELAVTTKITEEEILKLTKLTDLSRIKWAGATFACMLYDLEIDTVKKVTKCNPVDLHTQINQINKKQSIYKGAIGLNDIRIFVDASKDVPLEVEY